MVCNFMYNLQTFKQKYTDILRVHNLCGACLMVFVHPLCKFTCTDVSVMCSYYHWEQDLIQVFSV